MSDHQYPDHVVEAIHDRLQDAYGVRDIPVHVHEVLEWLWDATRIDTVEQLNELPWESVIIDKDGCAWEKDSLDYRWYMAGIDTWDCPSPDEDSELPAHVVFWGDES